jgi:hypothetical protein
VQRRRLWPTRITQWLQGQVQDRVVSPVLDQRTSLRAPLMLCVLDRVPLLQCLPARLIGLGIRPEHVLTPAAPRRRAVA